MSFELLSRTSERVFALKYDQLSSGRPGFPLQRSLVRPRLRPPLPCWTVFSHQHIQFGHCLGWVSLKQLSERLLQSREAGLVRSKLNHLLSLGGDSTLITEGPLPTRMLTTTSSRSLCGFKSL